MKIIQSAYFVTTSGESYRKKFADGRCRLHGVWMVPAAATSSGPPPQIKFSTGNDYADIRCQLTSPVNSASYWYSGGCVYDIPSDGILFEDGIYFEGTASTLRATIFFSGGAKA
tara:strand:- start:279 stop:620 length:342 start_codon:yes stop_codon:yes gene_type:complete